MGSEENKAAMRRWRDAWGSDDLAAIDAVVAPDYVGHIAGGSDLRGSEGDKQLLASYRAAFPDLRLVSEDVLAEGDRLVHRWTMHGTHRGDLMGIVATGARVAVPGISLFRFRGGRVVEGWLQGDRLVLLQQLGVIASGQAGEQAAAPPPGAETGAGGSPAEHKALIRRWYEEMWTGGNLALADALLDPAYVNHGQPPGLPAGPEGNKRYLAGLRGAFPDLQFAIEDEVAEGDRVATRWTMRGTHRGDLMGVAPTGRRIEVGGISIHRLAGGRVAESWFVSDRLGLLRQLGVAPNPGQAG